MSADELLPALAVLLSLIAATVVFLLLVISLYFKLRRLFPVNVNCWFCNKWTKVPYENKNCFDCPNCLQYNGFDETGDYNKEISAQYDEMQNFRSPSTKANLMEASNGLCYICNNNQQLKVFQLANFIPMNEENYDIEIEHFRKQLENAYKLCSKCDNRLKETIITQNKWLLGLKIKQLKQDSINTLINLKKSTKQYLLNNPRQSIFQSFLNVIIVVVASLILINAIHKAGIFDQTLYDNISSYYLLLKQSFASIYQQFLNYISIYLSDGYKNLKTISKESYKSINDIKDVFLSAVINCSFKEFNFSKSLADDMPESLKISDFHVNPVTVVGLSLQILASVFTQRRALKYPPLVLWALLVVLSANEFNKTAAFSAVQIFGSLLIIYTVLTEKVKPLTEAKNQHTPPENNVFNNVTAQYTPIIQQNISSESFMNSTYNSASDNDTDTANSDNSFQSMLSKSTMKTYNTCLNRTSMTSNQYDPETFSGPPIFRTFLTPSPNVFKNDFGNNLSTSDKMRRSFGRRNSGSENILNNSLDNLYIDKTNNSLYRLKSNESLNNLHLNNSKNSLYQFKPIEKINTFNANVCRPIISPPKLKIFNQSDWGSTYFPKSNISRSSSQSSGFMSQSPVISSRNSVCSDIDRESLFSYKPKSEMNFSVKKNSDERTCRSLSLRSFNHFY